MRLLRYNDAKNTPDIKELIEHNKKNMAIVLPNLNSNDTNPNSIVVMNSGCQMIALSFQNFDKNMEYYSLFFDKRGSAFVLKPENLRFVQHYLEKPKPPPKEWSFAPRKIDINKVAPGLGDIVNLTI